MTDQPTGYTWMQMLVRMTGEQSNVFLALMYQLRSFLETFSNPDGNVIILWTQTALMQGSTNLQKLPDCLVKLETYVKDHNGDPTGFQYGLANPPRVNWWDFKNPRFDCWAKVGCKVWRLSVVNGVVQGFNQSIPSTKEDRTMVAGAHMDVWEVWRPGNYPPDWFVVYNRDPDYWLVCLSDTTTEFPPST